MERTLIFGISSLLGTQLALQLRERHHIYGTYFQHRIRMDGVNTFHFPLSNLVRIQELIRTIKPRNVIYCAAMRNVAQCEQDPLGALYLNAEVPERISKWIEPYAGRLLYFSTAKVFNGDLGNYSEHDNPDSEHSHGKSKARAEHLLSMTENSVVLRIGSLFGLGFIHENSWLNGFLKKLLLTEEPVLLITDEYRSFMSTPSVAQVAQSLVEDRLTGLYNFAPFSRMSYFKFGSALAQHLGFPTDRVRPITGEEFSRIHPAPRERDTSLSGEKLIQRYPGLSGTLEDTFETLKRQLRLG